jgi:glutaredoxin-like protein NrdH
MVTVYSLPSCVQCDTTKRFLNKNGIEYTEVNLAEDEQAYEKIKNMGYTQAPVVEVGDKSWSGFRLDFLNKLSA